MVWGGMPKGAKAKVPLKDVAKDTQSFHVQKPWIKPADNLGKNGKGGKGGKGIKGGKDASKPQHSHFSEERKEQIRAQLLAKAEQEGRTELGDAYYEGTLVYRRDHYGWIKPTNIAELSEDVQEKMNQMTAEKKAKALENGRASSFEEPVIYLRMNDVSEGVQISVGDAVLFRLYTDMHGVGALDVFSSEMED